MEQVQAQKCCVRLDHLKSADAENLSEWNKTRLNRILVDYMLRMSYPDTAVKFAECENIKVVLLILRFFFDDRFFYFHLFVVNVQSFVESMGT